MKKMKKYSEGGGLREGRARFGDDIRARAMKQIEDRGLTDAEAAALLDREPRSTEVESKPVRMQRPVKAKALEETKVIADTTNKGRTGPEEDQPSESEKSKEAAARRKMWEKNGPIGDFMDAMRGKGSKDKLYYGMKKGGAVKSSASSRGDGIAQRGKTKGRIC